VTTRRVPKLAELDVKPGDPGYEAPSPDGRPPDDDDAIRREAGVADDPGGFLLPPLTELLAILGSVAEDKRRSWIHQVIRALATEPAETQQEYRDVIVSGGYMRPGDWREALAEAKKNRKRLQEPDTAAGQGQHQAPEEDALDITEEPTAVLLITDAISSGRFTEIYLRGDVLVQVTTGEKGVRTDDLNEAILRRQIADHLPCVKRTMMGIVGALPMPITCKAILVRPGWPKVPRLLGVATFPVPLADGTILQQPGYDAASGLYLGDGLGMAPIPEKPAGKQVTEAREFLLGKFLHDFPWMSDADRANALAMLLTPLLREIIGNLCPFFYITAPERGSGKTLLANLANILYNPGQSMRTLPAREEEIHKTITSALRGASPVIVFDNIPQDMTLKSPALAAVLTMRHWTYRILGGHRDGTSLNDRMWVATGTNVSLGGDFAQRSVRIAMDYGKPNPDLRKGFAIPEIEAWTAQHRGDVLRLLLILIRSWQLAGATLDTQQVMRGYTPWARTLGGILAFHQIPGFLANRDEIIGQDEDDAEMTCFLRMLKSRYGGRGVTTREILTDAAADRDLADALPSTIDGGKHTPKSLGKLLSGHEGKWYGRQPKMTLHRKLDHQQTSRWRVDESAD